MLRDIALLFLLGDARRWNAIQGQWESNSAPTGAGVYSSQLATVDPTRGSNPVTQERSKSKRKAEHQQPWVLESK